MRATVPSSPNARGMASSVGGRMVALDETDKRMLELLQADNRLTTLQLAAKLGLSTPTCLRRLRRLREQGVIVADVALIDPAAVGRALFVFIEVMFERQAETVQRAFELRMAAAPEVTQCYMVSGDTDFLIVVQVADMETFRLSSAAN
ncbi:Lrp/AsnC family transcriptional regulator [Phenylobacterium sp.]|uniref:Lrp/AsnC family transcriptional regulator n=1 Tax=Phenylobacterium sp. TaxID=1871053 RepID=UPI002EDA6C7E